MPSLLLSSSSLLLNSNTGNGKQRLALPFMRKTPMTIQNPLNPSNPKTVRTRGATKNSPHVTTQFQIPEPESGGNL
jgi:hypothetical protein